MSLFQILLQFTYIHVVAVKIITLKDPRCMIPVEDRMICGYKEYDWITCIDDGCCYVVNATSGPAVLEQCYSRGYTWVRYGDFEYAESRNVRKLFSQARQACAAEGGDLASIPSAQVQLWLMQYLLPDVAEACKEDDQITYWLGLTRHGDLSCQGNKCWKWISSDQPVSWTNWQVAWWLLDNPSRWADTAALSACNNYAWWSVATRRDYPRRYLCQRSAVPTPVLTPGTLPSREEASVTSSTQNTTTTDNGKPTTTQGTQTVRASTLKTLSPSLPRSAASTSATAASIANVEQASVQLQPSLATSDQPNDYLQAATTNLYLFGDPAVTEPSRIGELEQTNSSSYWSKTNIIVVTVFCTVVVAQMVFILMLIMYIYKHRTSRRRTSRLELPKHPNETKKSDAIGDSISGTFQPIQDGRTRPYILNLQSSTLLPRNHNVEGVTAGESIESAQESQTPDATEQSTTQQDVTQFWGKHASTSNAAITDSASSPVMKKPSSILSPITHF